MEQKFRDWTMKECIGEGAFGKVYRIEREDFGHTYQAALKVIKIPLHPSDVDSAINEGMTRENVTEYFYGMVEKIVEEFALMSKLKGNSHIVSYEDHYVEKNKNGFGWTIYIRMELLTPFYKYIKENRLTVKDVIQLGIDICHALEICQKYNIIHRDIKPENIFVSELGDFKLGDFGIARELEKTSSNLSKVGTKAYMAPEVFKGFSYNSNVDIYSLGIVLYRFLNKNRLPFMPEAPAPIKFSDKEKADMLRMSGQTVPKPCNADGRLAEIVIKACEYNPKDRYESAGEMRKALEEILYSEKERLIAYPDGDELENSRAEYVEDSKRLGQRKENLTNGRENLNIVSEETEKDEGTRYLFEQTVHQKTIGKTVEEKEPGEKRIVESPVKKAEASIVKRTPDKPENPVAEKASDKPKVPKADKQPELSKGKTESKHTVMKKIPERQEIITPEEKPEEEQTASKRQMPIIFGSVAVLFLIIGLVFVLKNLSDTETETKETVTASQKVIKVAATSTPEVTATPEITTPPSFQLVNVVNQPRSQAGEALRKQTKAKIAVTHQYSEKIKKGNVISQNPAAGTVFYNTDDTANYKVLQKISLVISKGSEYVTMPDLENKTLAGAKKKLKKLGLKVKVNSSLNSSYIKSGRVMYQSILSGKKVKKGTTITLTPSKGPAPVTYTNTATQSNSSSSTNRSSSSSSRRSSSSSSKKSSSSSKSSKNKNSSDFSSEDDARIVD